MAMLANDDVKQDHAGLFTFDPIGRIAEWRAAMLADPSHTWKIQQRGCHRESSNGFFRKYIVSLEKPNISGFPLCSDHARL
jgi:hypothetical protein